jgi:hypothetical protein
MPSLFYRVSGWVTARRGRGGWEWPRSLQWTVVLLVVACTVYIANQIVLGWSQSRERTLVKETMVRMRSIGETLDEVQSPSTGNYPCIREGEAFGQATPAKLRALSMNDAWGRPFVSSRARHGIS